MSLIAATRYSPELSDYEDIASEYYDSHLHPTCDDFRRGATVAHRRFQDRLNIGRCLEVGSGKSIVLEQQMPRGSARRNTIVLDQSSTMLSHSHGLAHALDAELLVGSAFSLPVRSNSIDCLVSHLGDPYNLSTFWDEVSRVVKAGGVALYTTPSFVWATRFRPRELRDRALFHTHGRSLLLASYIYHRDIQFRLVESKGLRVIDVTGVKVRELRPMASAKIQCLHEGDPVVEAYLMERRY